MAAGGDRNFDGRWAAFAVVTLVAIAVNLNTLANGFVFDDIQNIVQNRWIRDFSHLGEIFSTHAAGFDKGFSTSYYRPLMHVFYLLTYQAAGLAPWAFHFVNVLFHAGASALLFLALGAAERKSTNDAVDGAGLWSAAFVGALLFAVHPVHTEAIAWNAGITDLSFTFFYLLALFLYLRFADRSALARIFSAVAFFVAMLCKEPAATLPLVLAGCELAFREGSTRDALARLVRNAWPHAVALGAYIALRLSALHGMSPGERALDLGPAGMLLNLFPLFGSYIAKLAVPIRLNALYVFRPATSVFEPAVLASLALVAGLAAAAIRWRRKPRVLFGLLLTILPLAPALYLPALGEGVFAERYLYLPSAGFVWLVGLLFVGLRGATPRWKHVWVAAPLVLVFACGIATVRRNAVWKDSETLWTDTVRKSPDSAAAREYLGFALYSRGDLDGAIQNYREALRLQPDRASARVNLGVVLTLRGRVSESIAEFETVLRDHPGMAEAHQGLADALMEQGKVAEAVERFRAALTLNPTIAGAHNGLAIALWRSGRPEEAIAEFAEAARIDPNNPTFRRNLEQAREAWGQARNVAPLLPRSSAPVP